MMWEYWSLTWETTQDQLSQAVLRTKINCNSAVRYLWFLSPYHPSRAMHYARLTFSDLVTVECFPLFEIEALCAFFYNLPTTNQLDSWQAVSVSHPVTVFHWQLGSDIFALGIPNDPSSNPSRYLASTSMRFGHSFTHR
jgi:hypothetical protein